jgi:hypothetical protein
MTMSRRADLAGAENPANPDTTHLCENHGYRTYLNKGNGTFAYKNLGADVNVIAAAYSDVWDGIQTPPLPQRRRQARPRGHRHPQLHRLRLAALPDADRQGVQERLDPGPPALR